MSVEGYRDLELHDDEVFLALSLRELCALANLLRISARTMLSGDPQVARIGNVSPGDVVATIRHRLATDGSDVHALSEELGWALAGVLQEPDRIWDDWSLEGLRDVCARLGLDWRAMLPDPGSSAPDVHE